MAMVSNYNQFDGLHYETGTVRNVLAHLGVTAPHTGQPLSEAMLMGISGGAAFGYFLFDYKGFDPMLSLITRNTFDPLETLLTRLGAPREIKQTTDAKKAEANLLDMLDRGRPAIAWADLFSLPYNNLPASQHWWAMIPMVVFGVDGDSVVHLADRSRKPFRVNMAQFTQARARIKNDKFRLMELDAPDTGKLRDAAAKGIWQCIQLYTEKPPKGAATNFGFAAYRHWANMLTNTRNTQSWARFFAPPSALFSALAGYGFNGGLLGWVHTWGAGDGAERGMFADFLDEASALLAKPTLKQAAACFRRSRELWLDLARAALPDDAPLLREARELVIRRHALFVNEGEAASEAIRAINHRLAEIRSDATREYPMSESAITHMREKMSAIVMHIHDAEFEGVRHMQSAMA